MNKRTKAICRSLAIAVFGVAIGFLGELMPDNFKAKVQTFAANTFGISYTKCWLIAVVLVVLAMLYFVWRDALHNEEEPSNIPPGINPKVLQTGDKPIYIKDNKGPINIK